MTDFVHNISKGRVVEFYNRVDNNDPANAVFVIAVLVTTALDSVLIDLDDLAAVLADANTAEASNASYARKVLSDADLVAFVPDDANDRVDLDIPDQTWTGVGAGDVWSDLNICYDSDSTAGADANITPCTQHDFVVTPNGGDITANIAATGFYRAS